MSQSCEPADGLTRSLEIGGIPGVTPVWCAARPVLVSERDELTHRLERLATHPTQGAVLAEHYAAAWLCRRLVCWNICDTAGVPRPIEPASLRQLDPRVVGALFARVSGLDDPAAAAAEEQARATRLMTGIWLERFQPAWARRDCGTCQRYVMDDLTGLPVRHGGELVPRPAQALPPCRATAGGCPKGTPEAPLTLTASDRQVWLYDLECRTTGRYPCDAVVARNAVWIQAAEGSPAGPPHLLQPG